MDISFARLSLDLVEESEHLNPSAKMTKNIIIHEKKITMIGTYVIHVKQQGRFTRERLITMSQSRLRKKPLNLWGKQKFKIVIQVGRQEKTYLPNINESSKLELLRAR